jgi:hypothetical protein
MSSHRNAATVAYEKRLQAVETAVDGVLLVLGSIIADIVISEFFVKRTASKSAAISEIVSNLAPRHTAHLIIASIISITMPNSSGNFS